MVLLAFRVLGGLAVRPVYLNCPAAAVDGLELSLFGAKENFPSCFRDNLDRGDTLAALWSVYLACVSFGK